MPAKLRILKATLCLILLSVICGCAPAPEPTPPTDPAVAHTAASMRYNEAKYQLLEAPNRVVTYTVTESRTTAGQTFTQAAEGTASFRALRSTDPAIVVEEVLTFGSVTAQNREFYSGGIAGIQMGGFAFSSPMSAAEFTDRFPPAVLLDASIYGELTLTSDETGTLITFSQPKKLESWAARQKNARLVCASGSARLDADGALSQCTYSAQFTCGETAFDLSVSVQVQTPEELDLSLQIPADLSGFTPIACPDAPKILLQAAGDIFAAGDLSCTAEEVIDSEVIPIVRRRESFYQLSNLGELSAGMDHTVSLTDYRGQTVTSTQSYTVIGDNCFSSANGQDPVILPDITAAQLHTNVEDAILAGLFATRYIAGAEMTETEEYFILTFTGNEDYCTDLSEDICAFLELDLDGIAASFENTAATGRLTVSKDSLLPIAMEMTFSRRHIIGGVPYDLSYTLSQTLSFQ